MSRPLFTLLIVLLSTPSRAAPAPETLPAQEISARAEVDRPRDLSRRKARWTVRWRGGPATIWRGDRVVARNASSPWRSPRLAPGTSLVVRTPQGSQRVPLHHITHPLELARMSGDGLRGAQVVDTAPTARGPWVATAGGGAAWWDGERWHHLDTRHGLPSDTLTAVDVGGATRWFGAKEGLVRLSPEGTATPFPLPIDDLLADASGVWALSDGDVHRIGLHDTSIGPAVRTGCHALLLWRGETVVSCPDVVRLPTGSAVPELQGLPDQVTALVPRADGAWAITGSGLYKWSDGQLEPSDHPAIAGALDLLRVGNTLFLIDGSEALLRLDGEGVVHEVTRVHGLPDDRVLNLSAGPRPRTAWVGTRRGLALVEENGDAIALPLADLAVGRGARSVIPTRRGLAILTDDGPVHLGPDTPKGWHALVAAAGPGTVDLLRHGRHWLALRDEALLVLAPGGDLQRLATGSRRALGLRSVEPGVVAVVLQEGLRGWVPGARSLSAQDGPSFLRGALPSLRATLTWDDRHVRRLPPSPWTVRLTVDDAFATGRGWWLTTTDGMRWLTQDGRDQEPEADVRTLRGLTPTPSGLWGIDRHGRVLPLSADQPETDAPLPPADRLAPWPGGVAVLHGDGATLWRMPASDAP